MAHTCMRLLTSIVFACVAAVLGVKDDYAQNNAAVDAHRPVWGPSYKIKYNLTIPYVSKYQSTGLRYHVSVWRNSIWGLQKTIRDNVETTLEIVSKNSRYYINPQDGVYGCLMEYIDEDVGPSRKLRAETEATLADILPNLREPRWQYNGISHSTCNSCHLWEYKLGENKGYGTYALHYKFYVSDKGEPLQLWMNATSFFDGGHFDIYVADFYDYQAGPIPSVEFDLPDICANITPGTPGLLWNHMHHMMGGRLVPPQHHGDTEYDLHAHKHERRHASKADYEQRLGLFHQNKQLVTDHNDKGQHNFMLGLNRFADWTMDEYHSFSKGLRHNSKKPGKLSGRAKLHQPTTPAHMLPATVDWRSTGADSPVKDQASCGGCWAFGTVGPIETAIWREFGRQQLLSEQYLMDCSWSAGNGACLGGFQDKALDWIADGAGLPRLQDYPYLGISGMCKPGVSKAVAVKDYVYVPPYDEAALMDALLTKGPMTVSIDASSEAFRFYKSGIFNNSGCATAADDLDHAVLISGYGQDEQGRKYWIVKNIWSENWGESGYIRVAREPNDCGVSAQAMYVELDREETRRLMKTFD